MLRDAFGEPARTLRRPDRVRRHRGRHGLLRPHRELVPDLLRIACQQSLLGLSDDLAHPVAQVEVDICVEVGHAVAERLLPARGPFLQARRALLGLGQLADQLLHRLRVLLRRLLGPQTVHDLADHRQHVVQCRPPRQKISLRDDLLAQIAHERRIAGLGVHVLVAGPQGVPPQSRRHGEQLGLDARVRQVLPVAVGDRPPLRVEVGLGEHAGHVRAHGHGLLQELDLRRRVLLRAVGDQEHRVRGRQRRHRGGAVHGAEPADTGRVDEHQPLGQQRPGQADLDVQQAFAVAGIALLRRERRQLLQRHLGTPLGAHQRHDRRLRVPHRGRHGGGDVVGHRADRCPDEAVDQHALALLELADDQQADLVVGEPGPGLVQSSLQVRTVVAADGGERELDGPLR